jgi:tRNA pseudouridine38-40 synthase
MLSQRYFIELSFRGTNYHGWQLQPNAISVQACVNSAFEILLNEKIVTVGAGRTDTGVHAKFFTAHFDTSNSSFLNDPDLFLYKVNSILPPDIAMHRVYPVKSDVHARFSALSRTYTYQISRKKNPFNLEFAWYFAQPLNVNSMQKASEVLLEFHDFTSFSKLHGNTKTNDCKIVSANWEVQDNKLLFSIKADRFLRNMVRAIVGTLIEVGLGKITLDEFVGIIESKDRGKAGYSVPSQGLVLSNIEYAPDIIK